MVTWRAGKTRRGEAGRDFLLVKSRGVLALTVAQPERVGRGDQGRIITWSY